MPPKAKFTREEIARAAFSVVKEQGEDAYRIGTVESSDRKIVIR